MLNEVVAKDSSKLKFHFQRSCTYLHPRTSMLMFGPKNATARQIQYLHIPEWADKEAGDVSVAHLNKMQPVSNAIVMTATQFEGIPMADVFKVYMYWTFEAVRSAKEQSSSNSSNSSGKAPASLSRVRMGLRVDYLKMSMIKSQIFAGTKEELEVLSKQWELFFSKELKQRMGSAKGSHFKKLKKSKKKKISMMSHSSHGHGPHLVSLDHIVDYDALFEQASITLLHDCQLEATSSALWGIGWQKSAGYKTFLESEGDLEIELGEWEVLNEVVAKDSSKLKFHFQRSCTYLHPRTSMLMFGPKNATARQIQYLHIPEWADKEAGDVSVAHLNKMQPVSNAIVMTATQFEGIPMADVFKVYMYWTFEAVRSAKEQSSSNSSNSSNSSGKAPASLCRVRMGLRVDYLKSTMLKSQIFAGTKEELEALSKQWEQFQIGELAAGAKRSAAVLMSRKGDDNFYSDSDASSGSDEDSDSDSDEDEDGSAHRVSIQEQVQLALLAHDKRKQTDRSDSEGGPSAWFIILIGVVLVMQFVLLLMMYRKMSYLEGLIERSVAGGGGGSSGGGVMNPSGDSNTNSEL